MIERSVFTTKAGYLVVSNRTHQALFVPNDFAGINLSGVKTNVLDGTPNTIGSGNPLVTLSAGSKFIINIKPEDSTILYSNALWFGGDHYTPVEGKYKTTLVFPNLTAEQLAAKVDDNFTNVVFELSDGKQYGYIGGNIVLMEDQDQKVEVDTKLGVKSFKINIEGQDGTEIFKVPFDSMEATYKFVAHSFVSTDSLNPTYVPDKSVNWSILSATYDYSDVTISEDGVISGLKPGEIVIRAISTATPEAYDDYTIHVGAIDSMSIACQNGSNSVPLTFGKDENTGEWVADENIVHTIKQGSVNEFVFTNSRERNNRSTNCYIFRKCYFIT